MAHNEPRSTPVREGAIALATGVRCERLKATRLANANSRSRILAGALACAVVWVGLEVWPDALELLAFAPAATGSPEGLRSGLAVLAALPEHCATIHARHHTTAPGLEPHLGALLPRRQERERFGR